MERKKEKFYTIKERGEFTRIEEMLLKSQKTIKYQKTRT